METLAYTHIAVDYEELNSSSELSAFRNLKIKALKAVKFIAIAVSCITAGVFAGKTAQAAQRPVGSSPASGTLTLINDTPLGDGPHETHFSQNNLQL